MYISVLILIHNSYNIIFGASLSAVFHPFVYFLIKLIF